MIKTFRTIFAIASTERTLLYRSAKFWVLAGIGVLIVFMFVLITTIATILDDSPPGEFLLEGTDAFLALYFFSYVQAILIIFVAGDFRKAEEKARLDQVMLSRPLTTANWVVGKYLGTVSALIYLNLFLMALATLGRLFKVIFADAAFNVLPYLKYFAIATLPSILFMTALIFFLISLLRIQALATILPLGYVAALFFYFHQKFQGLLDYGSFFAPLFHSDLIGFGDIHAVLWQRLFFTLLAFALLGFSVNLYPRLEQSPFSQRIARASAMVFLIAAGFIGYRVHSDARAQTTQRQVDFAAQAQWITEPLCSVSHYDFDIIHGGQKGPLAVNVKMAIGNPHNQPLSRLVFALNDRLQVKQAEWHDGEAIPWQQQNQMLVLDIGARQLEPAAVDTIEIVYAGDIAADDFMLDRLPEDEGAINKRNGPWIKANISAWLGNDFAVLPAQCGWYPIPGAAAGYPYEADRPQDFATATLRVTTNADFQVISQGKKTDTQNRGDRKQTTFVVAPPVPSFSLNIGRYQRLARRFGDTQIEFYFHDKHFPDYDLFADVADTCYEAVDRALEIFNEVTGIPYPYPTISLVEVPTQMQIYTTHHGLDNVLLQPGVIMIDEVEIAGTRVKKIIEQRTKRAKRRGQDDSPARIKRDVFIDAVLDFLMPSNSWRKPEGTLNSPLRNYVNCQMDIPDPVFARALELEFYETAEIRVRDAFYPERSGLRLSSYDEVRQNYSDWRLRRSYGDLSIDTLLTTLEKVPLSQLRPQKDGALFRACLDYKAAPVLKMLRERAGEKNYLAGMRNWLATYRYRRTGWTDFLHEIEKSSGEKLDDSWHEWFDQATFPGYRITLAEAEKLDTGELKIVYQLRMRIQNGERGDGFVHVVCKTENDEITRKVELASYQEKELRFVVNEAPKSIRVVPYFSRNRGAIMKPIAISNRIRRSAPQDTVFAVTTSNDSLSFVLDDQDNGFFTPVSEEAKYLRPPSKGRSWWEDTDRLAFGKYYFGWRVKRGGSGDYPARWEAHIQRTGDYEVSFFLPVGQSWYTRNLNKNFPITITSAEGTQKIDLQPQETADGWLPLGRFHFKKDESAIIELADSGSGYFIADAVRWEFID